MAQHHTGQFSARTPHEPAAEPVRPGWPTGGIHAVAFRRQEQQLGGSVLTVNLKLGLIIRSAANSSFTPPPAEPRRATAFESRSAKAITRAAFHNLCPQRTHAGLTRGKLFNLQCSS